MIIYSDNASRRLWPSLLCDVMFALISIMFSSLSFDMFIILSANAQDKT